MKLPKTLLKCSLLLFALSYTVLANNMTVTNVSIVNVAGGSADIQFDISWSNSWRWTETVSGKNITNHDAAWVFIKFRAGVEWQHAWLAASGHSPSAGAKVDVASNGGDTNIGAFVYRNADGHGNFVCNTMRLRWDFSKNGLTKTNNVDISVQAIEMVYVPERAFYVGSGGSELYPFYMYPNGTVPYYITNNAAIHVGANTGELYYSSQGDRSGPIPAAFPKGFSSFYCMKYEITQGQYAKFLNYLPSGYDYQHYPDVFGLNRHTIHLVNGNYITDTPDRACNYLAWSDVSAYCDWAGLRPMTELEFEKACRGPLTPIPNEYPWGDTIRTAIVSYDGVDGSGAETAFPTNANCHFFYNSTATIGPTRAGIFARQGTTRHQAGASYSGIMELGGNLWEQVVTVGNPQGRSFNGCHGDGYLQTAEQTWPISTGAGKRGGDWSSHTYYDYSGYIRISDRYAATAIAGRDHFSGGRGVHSAQ